MANNHYDEKRTEIDFEINKYTLKCLRTMLFVILLVWMLNILHIFIVNMELMSKGFMVATGILIFTQIFGKLVDLRKEWVKYLLIVLTIATITVLGVTLTYHTLLLSVFPILIATQYTDKKVLTCTFLLIIVSTYIIVMGGYFWGLCDANMLLLTTEPTRFYQDVVGKSISIESINTNPWYTLPLYFVFPRCILLALIIPVIQSISKNIMNSEQYAATMKRLSEIDEMTGLFNRNKYLSMIQDEYRNMDRLCVIFLDVNNLKQINDTLGHEKGDQLITTVGRIVLTLTEVNKKGYRIGGNEFVIIVENPREGEVDDLLQKWEELVAMKSKTDTTALSVAVGYACGEGKDIDKIIKEADQLMYQKKKEQKTAGWNKPE